MLIRQSHLDKQLDISFETEMNELSLLADPRRLKQILVNLLQNAAKFTPSGGAIGLRVTESMNPSESCFEIWDKGIGMAVEDKERIFKPYVQLDNGLNRHQLGLGLGLSLVDQLVKLQGGRIAVESEKGKGTSFFVYFPIPTPGSTETPDSTEIPAPEKNVIVRSSGADERTKILLAEDNEFNQETIRTFLESKGFLVTIANNGLEALQMASANPPHLIIMDIQMPLMDGLEATKQLRERVATKDTPIVALTAMAMPGDREKCLSAGMSDYLPNIRLTNLLEHLNKHLHERDRI